MSDNLASLCGILVFALVWVGCGGKLSVTDEEENEAPDSGAEVTDAGMADGSDVRQPPRPAMDMGMADVEVVTEGPVPNEGWIGGPCVDRGDCEFEESFCLSTDDHPGGQCALGCDRICPDRDGNNSVTFCIDDGGEGICVSQCDFDLYPDGGCRDGYACRIQGRFGEAGTQRSVCVPADTPNPDATTACLRALDENGVIWAPWNYDTQYDDGLACTVDDPIRVASPINGVTYRYYNQESPGTMAMACELALALHRLGDLLAEHDVTDVLHIGTFNCRKIGGTSRLSQHGHGMAIDIWGLEDVQGEDYILERDWEHETDNPQDPKAKLLYDIAQGMHDDQIFNIVLTPNYNAAHDNHFHVDLTPGSDFIGLSTPPEYYIGNDPEQWAEHCPGD